MVDELEILNNPHILSLARKVKDLDKVEQVRWWKSLPSKFKDRIEENGRFGTAITLAAIVKGVDHTYDSDGAPSSGDHSLQYTPILTMLNIDNYNDESQHEKLILKIKEKIEDYYKSGTTLARVYHVDEN